MDQCNTDIFLILPQALHLSLSLSLARFVDVYVLILCDDFNDGVL